MPDYSLWQNFSEITLNIDNAKDITVQLSRDNNYNINASIIYTLPKGKKLRTSPELLFNKIFKDKNNLLGYLPQWPEKRYLLSGILINSTTYNYKENQITYSGTIQNINEYYNNNIAGEPKYSVYWFLNTSSELSYTECISIEGQEHETIQWGNLFNDTFNFNSPRYIGWDAIKLKYLEYQCLFGRVKKDSNEIKKSSFLRFQDNAHPSIEEIKEIYLLLSYILGSELIYIGNTKYNNSSSPVGNEFNSTFRKDIEKVISNIELPPIPIRINDRYSLGIDPENQINLFIEKYLEKKNSLNLLTVIWYLNYARTQHPQVMIQPLSTAFDILCTSYFEKKSNTYIDKILFKKILSDFQPVLSKHIDDKNIMHELNNRFRNCNNNSINRRNQTIFKELDLNLSDFEKEALQSRNIAIHGSSIISIDPIKTIMLANFYATLMNRLLLRMLDMEYYIDYSEKGTPTKPIAHKQGGQYNIYKL